MIVINKQNKTKQKYYSNKRERHVSYYYEKENRNLDHISSLTTSPFDFKENRQIKNLNLIF